MKPELIMRSDLLDILFEGRNKSYGAYALRKEYPKELMKALSVVGLILISLLLYSFIDKGDKKSKHVNLPPETETVVKFLNNSKPMEPLVKKTPAVKPPVATVANPVPHIVPDELAKPKTKTTKELEQAIISDSTVDGQPVTFSSSPSPASNGDGNGVKETIDSNSFQPEIFSAPDVAAEFPGGTDGWVRFLKKNLRPKESDDAYKVTVIVSFVVNEDGTISDLHITQSGGEEFDNEVMRVMKKSPKWNAGIYHGKNVKVYHSQPVIFVNQSDE
jgi:protein TonB